MPMDIPTKKKSNNTSASNAIVSLPTVSSPVPAPTTNANTTMPRATNATVAANS